MNFCTLFDSNYIHKGIALYLSLRGTGVEFTLYVMAMDRECKSRLDSAGFGDVVVECIDDIEDDALEIARRNRSRAEFCWTCGSYVTHYFLEKYAPEDMTYLDSDLMFFSSPSVIMDELRQAGASVGLSPHFNGDDTFGRYCVQYVYFKNDCNGAAILEWWRDECLKWCYSKLEDGKYGDQKYLENFSSIAPGVHDIGNRGCGVAYWNMYDYDWDSSPVVFFHYSGVNVMIEEGVLVLEHTFYLPQKIKELCIVPYSGLLAEAYSRYLGVCVSRTVIRPVSRIGNEVKHILYLLRGSKVLKLLRKTYMTLKYRERKSPYSER